MNAILYVGQAVADELWNNVESNLQRYLEDGFEDLVEKGNWSLPLRRVFDPGPLKELDPRVGAAVEVENSRLVWKSLGNALNPSLATENRIWVRLSHVECLEFSKDRWLTSGSDEVLTQRIRAHFFANTRTAARDDHVLSRLWWNGWIARQVNPDDPESALEMILKSADVRSNLVERPWIFARPALARGIFRAMDNEAWVLQAELHFREFIKAS